MSARPRRTGLASSRARFQQRAAQVRRRPWRLAGWTALVVVLITCSVWVVAFSPLLAVRTVEVVGVPAAEVAPITAMAQVTLGAPLARLDADGIADRVRQRATLANVSIERSWPSTLVIHASPRVPFWWPRTLKVNYTLWIVEAWRMRRSGPLPRVSRWCTQPRTKR